MCNWKSIQASRKIIRSLRLVACCLTVPTSSSRVRTDSGVRKRKSCLLEVFFYSDFYQRVILAHGSSSFLFWLSLLTKVKTKGGNKREVRQREE